MIWDCIETVWNALLEDDDCEQTAVLEQGVCQLFLELRIEQLSSVGRAFFVQCNIIARLYNWG